MPVKAIALSQAPDQVPKASYCSSHTLGEFWILQTLSMGIFSHLHCNLGSSLPRSDTPSPLPPHLHRGHLSCLFQPSALPLLPHAAPQLSGQHPQPKAFDCLLTAYGVRHRKPCLKQSRPQYVNPALLALPNALPSVKKCS